MAVIIHPSQLTHFRYHGSGVKMRNEGDLRRSISPKINPKTKTQVPTILSVLMIFKFSATLPPDVSFAKTF